jgi:AcrR family transcriptional regulator
MHLILDSKPFRVQDFMMNEKTNTKDELFFQICHNVLKLEVSKGHLKWTLSDVAKESDITRSLIYYYFGKSKDNILEEAYRYMIDVIFNMQREVSIGIQERMTITLAKIQEMPYLFVLFFLEKNSGSKVSEMISAAEVKLLSRLQDDYPEKSEDEILSIYLMQLGAVAHNLDVSKSNVLFQGLNRTAKK